MSILTLTPAQVSEQWDYIRQTMRETMPDEVELREDYVLAALISGYARCWISMTDDNAITALAITMITQNVMAEGKDLLIFHLYGVKSVTTKTWKKYLEEIKKYAKENDCKKITAYASDPRVAKWHDALGGNSSIRYSYWEV